MFLKQPLTFLIFINFLILCLKFWIICAATGPKHGKVVVCYLASWSRYRPLRGSFVIEDIDPTLCTHIVYAYAGLSLTHDGIISLDEWQTNDNGERSYNRLASLKQSYPHLKITLSIGGWVQGSTNYSIMVQDPAKRKRFVANALQFVKKYNFDGLDLHWQFPGSRGGAPIDKLKFSFLVQELGLAFSEDNLLLTSIFGTSKAIIDAAYEVQELSKYLDYIYLMSYDFHGSWNEKLGANSPLRSSTDTMSVEHSVNYLIKLGASPSKLVLGLPLYGKTFRLVDAESEPKLGSPTEKVGFQGQFTRSDGFIGYNEICLEFQNLTSGYKTYWDEESETPFAVNEKKVISYDNERSLLEKIKFAMKKKLGGVTVWSIDTDDFKGDCGMENYPLLRSINKLISETLEDINPKKNVDHIQESSYTCDVNVIKICN